MNASPDFATEKKWQAADAVVGQLVGKHEGYFTGRIEFVSAKPSSNAGQGFDAVRQTRDEIKRRILQLQAQEQLSTNTVPT